MCDYVFTNVPYAMLKKYINWYLTILIALHCIGIVYVFVGTLQLTQIQPLPFEKPVRLFDSNPSINYSNYLQLVSRLRMKSC